MRVRLGDLALFARVIYAGLGDRVSLGLKFLRRPHGTQARLGALLASA